MRYSIIPGVILLLFLATGCSINNDIMLRTGKDYQFDDIPEEPDLEYKISPDDVLQFRLFANDGFRLIDVTSGSGSGGGRNQVGRRGQISYLVEQDGRVKLPVLGRINVEGMTVREAEIMLEEKYSEYYNKPFVILNVSNRRVIVFPGSGGSAQVITLQNNNTTLMEVLAMAGGISSRGRAREIKLMRKTEEGKRKIFKIDLSTIKGIRHGDLVVQADDIIYVEPMPQLASQVVQDIAPILSLLTSALFVYSTVARFSQ